MEKIKLAFSSLYYSILLWLPNEFSKYRVRYYNRHGCKINSGASIAPNVRIKGRFEMGAGSSIAQNCSIAGEKVGVILGANVMIAPNVVIVAFNHVFDSLTTPMSRQGKDEGQVVIGDDVWIAANCTIGKGVTIGQGTIIAANSFVNKDIPPFSIAGGVPAIVFKSRTANFS